MTKTNIAKKLLIVFGSAAAFSTPSLAQTPLSNSAPFSINGRSPEECFKAKQEALTLFTDSQKPGHRGDEGYRMKIKAYNMMQYACGGNSSYTLAQFGIDATTFNTLVKNDIILGIQQAYAAAKAELVDPEQLDSPYDGRVEFAFRSIQTDMNYIGLHPESDAGWTKIGLSRADSNAMFREYIIRSIHRNIRCAQKNPGSKGMTCLNSAESSLRLINSDATPRSDAFYAPAGLSAKEFAALTHDTALVSARELLAELDPNDERGLGLLQAIEEDMKTAGLDPTKDEDLRLIGTTLVQFDDLRKTYAIKDAKRLVDALNKDQPFSALSIDIIAADLKFAGLSLNDETTYQQIGTTRETLRSSIRAACQTKLLRDSEACKDSVFLQPAP